MRFIILLRIFFTPRSDLLLENIVLKHQLSVLLRQRKSARKRIILCRLDRILWVWLSRLWTGWREALIIVKPDTIIRWHRRGFRLYWRWKSLRGKTGRPGVSKEIRDLVRRMALENPTWGSPRIHAELKLLGFRVAQSTVAKYLPRTQNSPSQSWRTFLKNCADGTVACDFFQVPTLTFGVLTGFVVLSHERRRIVRIAVTRHPSAHWAAQQRK